MVRLVTDESNNNEYIGTCSRIRSRLVQSITAYIAELAVLFTVHNKRCHGNQY